MERKIFTLFFLTLFIAGAFAQKPEAVVMEATAAPVIDGVIEEVWDLSEAYNIDLPFQAELPTLGESGDTYWKALWFEDAMYVLIVVTDDDHLPHDVAEVDHYQADKPEIYWDCNFDLNDGVGASGGAATGHYQVAPFLTQDNVDGTPIDVGVLEADDAGVIYAYLLDDPNYVAEYMVPFSYLNDKDGAAADLTGTLGFDVTVIDRDEGDTERKRAVWANIGGQNESWNTMDDCGLITFDGKEPGIDIESIELTAGDITENNQPLQIVAAILPENAANKTLDWSINAGGTARATISNTGLVTPITNGTITVTAAAKDLGFEDDEIEITITGQMVSMAEINLIRNGYFDQTNDEDGALEWSGTGIVEDGVVSHDPNPDGVNYWDYTMTQQTFGCNTTDTYTFSFYLWADATDTVNVDFEDSANDYLRYGSSTHELAVGGLTDWVFESETEPTKYVFDIVFTNLQENTNESCQFMLGLHDPVVYIDSVILINNNDLALVDDPVAVPVTSITVSSAGDATEVTLDATLQMSVDVLPADATMGGAWWSVVNGTGEATIDAASGLLTPVKKGTVTVVATAKDDSRVFESMDIDVLWAVGIPQQSMNEIKVYPNPVGNELHVVLTSVNETVTIYNSIGAKMEEAFVNGTEYTFNVSNYAQGLYFVKAGSTVVKFIK